MRSCFTSSHLEFYCTVGSFLCGYAIKNTQRPSFSRVTHSRDFRVSVGFHAHWEELKSPVKHVKTSRASLARTPPVNADSDNPKKSFPLGQEARDTNKAKSYRPVFGHVVKDLPLCWLNVNVLGILVKKKPPPPLLPCHFAENSRFVEQL
ncbi:hypothetical protein RUM44_012773 [Polyplax serrata]|uniref:Uncharacterized protein n=1 Tax=Polyplax serrata TaxID=468196 RepID=A0ABR1BE64_POLSC